MHCQEFPEQTERTFLKQRSRSKGVPWVLDLKMMPMMLFLVLRYSDIEGFAFAEFCTARSICLGSGCRIFGAPDLGFGESCRESITWLLLISIDCWFQNQFKIALWEALAACSMLLKVIAWSTLCLMSQASFEYFGMVLSCCQKRQCSWSWWDHLERIRVGSLVNHVRSVRLLGLKCF